MRKLVVLVLILLSIVGLSLTVIDDAGRIVEIEKKPERIVSVSPAATKFFLFLGIERYIVGVTNWDSYEKAERIGDMVPLNIEKIFSLNPDLVVSFGGFQLPEVEKLERKGLKVLVLNPVSLKDILKDLVLVGVVMGEEEKARKMAKDLENKMISLGKKTYNIPPSERPKVLFLMSPPGPELRDIWTCGEGSYLNELISLSGGINIASGIPGPNGWPQISIEYVVAMNPDVIIVASFSKSSENTDVQKVLDFPPFKSVNAVKEKRVFSIDGNLASQPSPYIFELLDVFYSIFHGGSKE
ncbi:MAG: cobalamin-binding protein [Thermotoga sp. 4484_232]|nr:ABC transporter substrate-binding protein [Thermotogaceae bacterium]OQX59037.1 MAG: cobalamin-binding protein [Thermotoga sp. 4484_232]